MPSRWKLSAPSLALAALAASGTALAGDGVYEVNVYGISQFGDYWNCGESSQTHDVHTETAAAFRQTFDLLKMGLAWDTTRSTNNPYARGTYFSDAAKSAPCSGCTSADTATSGADSSDVIYIHTHGGHNYDYWGFNDIPGFPTIFSNSALLMGSASYGCNVFTDGHMLFGQTDLNVAVVKACQSGDYDVFLDGGYDSMSSDSGEFNMWNAFHGDSSCGGAVTSYVGDYAATSINDGVGENWLDEAYDSWGADDCPVSIVYGSTAANRNSMYYWGGWKDLKSTGSKSGSAMYYINGCDPDNGSTLP